jgi:hypothetical protein
MIASSEESVSATPVEGPVWPQHYGSGARRVMFGKHWKDVFPNPFYHAEQPNFHRLQTSLDTLYSRCEQPIGPVQDRPIRVSVKLLCYGEAGRTLFTLGLKSKSHGCWGFNIGACPTWGISFGKLGWQIINNSADPWHERVSLAGFDNGDWHLFTFSIPDTRGPTSLFCDGQFVMNLRESITDLQRAKVREEQNDRHGSVQQMVPQTNGDGDYLFIESRHPGQIIDIDQIHLSQEPLTTRRATVPVVLDQDWELDGTRLVENTFTRYEQNPVLKRSDIPDPTGQGGASLMSGLRDETGFHLYFDNAYEVSKAAGRVTLAIQHAYSSDGTNFEVTPKTPVLTPGAPGDWDFGCLGQVAVLKEKGIYRMWYGGYTDRLHQGRAGYAESSDGVNWKRQILDTSLFAGRPSNVCLSLQQGPHCNEYELPVSVVRADEAPANRRYVMFLHTQGPHGFIVDVAVSSDGKLFTRAAHNSRDFAFEEIPRGSSLHGAAVVLHEPHYWWAVVEQDSKQDQEQTRFAAWVVEPDDVDNISFGLWRSQRLHLEPQPQSWDQTYGRVGCILEVGNEWWAYYTSKGSVGLAKVGRHRMYGVELCPEIETGQVTSIGLEPPKSGWEGHHLAINVTGFATGTRIEAELLNGMGQVVTGYRSQESVAIQADGYEIPLAWRGGGTKLPNLRVPIRVRLALTRGSGSPQLHAVYVKRGE